MKKRHKVLLVAAALLVAISVAAYFLFTVSLTVAQATYPPLKVIFRARNLISSDVSFSADNATTEYESLWSISVPGGRLGEVTYGTVPPGCKQTFPENGTRPRPIKNGENISVHVGYVCDDPVPSLYLQTWRYRINEDTVTLIDQR